MGEEKRRGQVITTKGDKWNNEEYWHHTRLREYFPYMFGGGYVVSSDIARALHLANHLTGLKIFPNEDATFGFWVSGLNLRRVSHPGFHTAAGSCCLTEVERVEDEAVDESAGPLAQTRRMSTDLWRLQAWEPLCAGWMVLHKVESAAMMHFLHARIRGCDRELRLLADAGRLRELRDAARHAAGTAGGRSLPQKKLGSSTTHLGRNRAESRVE